MHTQEPQRLDRVVVAQRRKVDGGIGLAFAHPLRTAYVRSVESVVTYVRTVFQVDEVPLPAAAGVSDAVRRRVALIVIRLQRGDTPEDIVHRPSIDASRIFEEDDLEREEALAHADIVLSLLSRPDALLGLASWMNVRSIP